MTISYNTFLYPLAQFQKQLQAGIVVKLMESLNIVLIIVIILHAHVSGLINTSLRYADTYLGRNPFYFIMFKMLCIFVVFDFKGHSYTSSYSCVNPSLYSFVHTYGHLFCKGQFFGPTGTSTRMSPLLTRNQIHDLNNLS